MEDGCGFKLCPEYLLKVQESLQKLVISGEWRLPQMVQVFKDPRRFAHPFFSGVGRGAFGACSGDLCPKDH